MTEVLRRPPSQIDTIISQAEHFSSPEEQAARIVPLVHSMWVTETAKAKHADEELMVMKQHPFEVGKDGSMYLQPRIPHLDRGEQDFDHYFEMPEGKQGKESVCSTADHDLFLVDRGHTIRVPLSRKPYAFMSMTSCTCLAGVNETELLVAHVGLSEHGSVQQSLELFEKQGIQRSAVLAVVGIGEYVRTFKQDEMTDLGQMPIQSENDLVEMGVLEKNIRAFDGFAGVVATKDYVASYMFDKLPSKWGFSSFHNPVRYSEETRDMQVMKFS